MTAFSFADPPFDGLTPKARLRLAEAADVGWYPEGAPIADKAALEADLFVVLAGAAVRTCGADVVSVLRQGEVLWAGLPGGLPEGTALSAVEDTVCHLVPAPLLRDLIRSCPAFSAALEAACGKGNARPVAPSGAGGRGVGSFLSARIRGIGAHLPPVLDAAATARDAAAAMKAAGTSCALIRRQGALGLLEGRDLRDACILRGEPPDTPVGPLARWDPVTLDADDPLVDALVAAREPGIRHLVVRDGGVVAGLLEEADLLKAAADPALLLAAGIGRAASVAELEAAARETAGMVRDLHAKGAGIRFLAELTTELNRRLFAGLFALLAPPELAAGSCLIVMGSEGRGEQILRTDQDNGLIVREGMACPGLERVAEDFTRTLIGMGWPECRGGVMVRNPGWRRTLPDWKDTLRRWIRHPGEDALLNLAVFYDAHAVAGDSSLLAEARGHLSALLSTDDVFFARFARPTLNFDTPAGPLAFLRWVEIDVKKSGIFPIVHGVRSLAIQRRLEPVNTFERIAALEAERALGRDFAAELCEALSVLMELRLKLRLEAAGDTAGGGTGAPIRAGDLTRLERDMLRDALAVAKRFKELVSYHFHLDLF